MGKFTVRGSEALDEIISDDLSKVIQGVSEVITPDGVVLIGGYGRGEGTPYISEKKQYPYNDYDIIVIENSLSPLERKKNQIKLHHLEKKLEEKVHVPVDLFLHTSHSLKHAEPSLLNYEMLHGHTVLKGPETILKTIMPHLTLDDISLSEGTRLLLNRGTLLLYNKIHPEKKHYLKYILKAHLAMGDCLLLAKGKYHISYEKKKKTIATIDEFPWIKKRYLEAVSYKEWADDSQLCDLDLQETIEKFISFFLWYETERLKRKIGTIHEYEQALYEKPSPIREKFKALLLNLYYRQYHWILHHPRQRLYVTLLKLLSGNKQENIDTFIKLRKRFS